MENNHSEPPAKKQKTEDKDDRPFHYKLLKKHLKKHTSLFKEYKRGVLLFAPQKREGNVSISCYLHR